MSDNFESFIKNHNILQEKVEDQTIDQKDKIEIMKEYTKSLEVIKQINDLKAKEKEKEDLESIISSDEDEEIKKIAKAEITDLKTGIDQKTKQIKIMLLPRDICDERNVIIEIRAGTGGDEATLFAADLCRMYKMYASKKRWEVEEISEQQNEKGGIKESVFKISGQGVYSFLKFESGVHRVQRVPETESQGRVHTSAATVAVLPEAKEVDIEIKEADIRIDTYRASGAGGQHVNKTDSAVRITHIPTGVVVAQQDEKSQHKNKARAMQLLRSRILDQKRQEEAKKRSKDRKEQVGSGDRSERIRTYNFPQNRVTDHRINLTIYKLTEIINGEDPLNDLITNIIEKDQEARLSS